MHIFSQLQDLPCDDKPVIYGEFTGWRPHKFFTISEFCERIDERFPSLEGLAIDKQFLTKDSDLTWKDLPFDQINELKAI